MGKTVGIVSLSSGTIGEDFVKHEVDLGIRRLEEYGLSVKFMPHARKGIDYVKENPQKRAEDLLQAFEDPEVDMILCAIGGDDTYRLLPYLFENDALKKAVKNKIFLGFSDSTMNHFMLHKVGLPTFYGQAFLSDVCEMEQEMLPYTRKYFEELIKTGGIREITCGMKAERITVKASLEQDCQCIRTEDLSFFREMLFFAGKFWEAVLIRFLICLTGRDTRIPRSFAGATSFSHLWKTGRERFFFWNQVRRKCLLKNTERLLLY